MKSNYRQYAVRTSNGLDVFLWLGKKWAAVDKIRMQAIAVELRDINSKLYPQDYKSI